jgi:hypothetical protein
MMVRGKRLADTPTLHEQEAHCIAQGPALVGPPPQELEGGAVEFRVHKDDLHSNVGLKLGDELQDELTWQPPHLGQRDELGKHIVVGQADRSFDEASHCVGMLTLCLMEVAE